MKLLILLLLPAFTIAQVQVKKDSAIADTVRASLLLTRKKMTIAHNYEGHAVIKQGRVVEFLDDRKKRFHVEVIVWDYRINKK